MNGVLKRMWKEAVIVQFDLITVPSYIGILVTRLIVF
jgi:hypothetical protein